MMTKVQNLLNYALDKDPQAIRALFAMRVDCNEVLADHPTIQVRGIQQGATDEFEYDVGILGIINGFFETDERGHGPIQATFDDKGILIKFKVDDEWQPKSTEISRE